MPKISDVKKKVELYKYIRNMILRRELLPGDKIPEAEIAKELHVSRTPVREAVRQLAWHGIITMEPNKSATVTVLDDKFILDISTVRWAHERVNIPLVIYNGSNRDFAELREYADKCVECNEAGDINGRYKYDAKFHMLLYLIGGNEVLIRMHRSLELMIGLWMSSTIMDPKTQKEEIQRHRNIVDYLEARDVEGLTSALYTHYCNSYGIEIPC